MSINKIPYGHRILIDKHFLVWLKGLPTEFSRAKYDTLKFLSIINTTSTYHGFHNLMLAEHYKEIIGSIPITEKELQWLLKPVQIYPVEETDDEISKVVKIAIALSNDRPFKTAILTSTECKAEYLASPHMQNVKDVVVFNNQDGVAFVNKIFRTEYEAVKNGVR